MTLLGRAALTCGMAVMAAIAAPAQQEPSLAERAAAARHAESGRLSPEIAGRVVRDDYINEFFGLTIRHLPGWESLSAGRMNVTEALGREAMGLSAGITGSASGRVFGMHDEDGTSVFVSVRPIPPGIDLSDVGVKMRQAVVKEIPSLRCADESASLSTGTHPFVAFRCMNNAENQVFYQDQQATVTRNHLIVLTLTAPTENGLNALLRQIRAHVVWSDGRP